MSNNSCVRAHVRVHVRSLLSALGTSMFPHSVVSGLSCLLFLKGRRGTARLKHECGVCFSSLRPSCLRAPRMCLCRGGTEACLRRTPSQSCPLLWPVRTRQNCGDSGGGGALAAAASSSTLAGVLKSLSSTSACFFTEALIPEALGVCGLYGRVPVPGE